MKLVAVVTDSPMKRMTGCELRRLRLAAGMDERQVATGIRMYRRRVQRWEEMAWFELQPAAMQELVNVLGARV